MREVSYFEFRQELRKAGPRQWIVFEAQFDPIVSAQPNMRYLVEDPASPAHTRCLFSADTEKGECRLYFTLEEGADDAPQDDARPGLSMRRLKIGVFILLALFTAVFLFQYFMGVE